MTTSAKDDENGGLDGFRIAICGCEEGPYIGARKAGTPCCCERCGFMIQEQYDYLISAERDRAADIILENCMHPHVREDGTKIFMGGACDDCFDTAKEIAGKE